jgi:iron complex transport system ATP-binding protein
MAHEAGVAVTSLAATKLTLMRGGRVILQDLSLAAMGGEFIAVIGPNGAGKSTLLAALAGLSRPDSGTVQLDAVPVAGLTARDLARRRGYLPQNARCEWPLAVERMVALGLAPLGHEDAARVDAVLADCDLLALRKQAVTTLSGGELARAMLARALVADPAVLIVDEPLAGLDPRHAWDAARRLRSLAMEQRRLVIASIHDLNIALRLATRVWALRDGRLLADGAPEAVLDGALLGALFDMKVELRRSCAGAWVDFAP